MAITGKINFKGISMSAYITVSINGVSKEIDLVRVEYELGKFRQEESKIMKINFGYSIKADKESEQIGNGTEYVLFDAEENPFKTCYDYLAAKFNISNKEI